MTAPFGHRCPYPLLVLDRMRCCCKRYWMLTLPGFPEVRR